MGFCSMGARRPQGARGVRGGGGFARAVGRTVPRPEGGADPQDRTAPPAPPACPLFALPGDRLSGSRQCPDKVGHARTHMRGSQFRIDIPASRDFLGRAGCHLIAGDSAGSFRRRELGQAISLGRGNLGMGGTSWGDQWLDDPAFPDPGRIATQADFGRELTALRERARLKIREVARAAGTPVSTIRRLLLRAPPADRQAAVDPDPRRLRRDRPRPGGRWEAALHGRGGRRAGGAGTPYRGLARFEAEDARWFFGREDVTDLLVSLAAEDAPLPLMLVGPSGAGKSRCCGRACCPGCGAGRAAPGIAGR